jgi:hypothetical protein
MRIATAPGPGQAADAHLEAFVPYVYRGTGKDTLTPRLYGPPRNKGRRKLKPTGKCPDCGYGRSGRNHRQICGPE